MPSYRIETCTLKDTRDIEQQWCALQEDTDCSYFQSWGWIETWLDVIALKLQPLVVRVWYEDKLVGIGLFVSKDIKRRLIFCSRAMYLNEYPFDGNNMITEFNGLLVAKKFESDVYANVLTHLLQNFSEMDEFCFGAVLENTASFITEPTLVDDASCMISEESISYYIELSEFQPGIENYLATLSRNRRGQIRRALRLYETNGVLNVEQAENVEQALHYFERLKILHTDYWQSKGKGGSFANATWEMFHHDLIQKRFDFDEVQLLKVSNQQGEVAYIYNLVMNKHVYVIQTGFKQSTDKRLMPGYVAHSMAVSYNCAKANRIYDLMHGETLYKQILCNRTCKLQWLVVQKKRIKFTVENIAVSLVRLVRGIA